jgi:serine/threonine protein phosphatase 1
VNRKIAIGDIHGCNKTFNKLLYQILKIRDDDSIYLLGDYIDRGPDSKGVIDTILKLQTEGYDIVCLRGNHEQILLDSGQDLNHFMQWLLNGGDSTMESFGAKRYKDFPIKYKLFFESTQLIITIPGFVLVHAGLNFKKNKIFEDKNAMLWARGFKSFQPKLEGLKLIHGHTPIPLKKILEQNGNCINIDGGCVFNSIKKNCGYLVACILETMEFKYVKCID